MAETWSFVVGILQELRLDIQDVVLLIGEQLGVNWVVARFGEETRALLWSPPQSYGNKRSFVRKIGTKLPLKSLPRLHFTYVPLDSDLLSIASGTTVFKVSEEPKGLANIPVLDPVAKIEKWGKSNQRARNARLTRERNYGLFSSSRIELEDEGVPDDIDVDTHRSDSPSSFCADSLISSQSTVDTVALSKISALEDELAKLRELVAKIVSVDVNNTQNHCSGYGSFPCTPIPPPPIFSAPPPPPPPLCNSAPPPPPPPPFSMQSSTPNNLNRKMSLQEQLAGGGPTLKSAVNNNNKPTRTKSVPSMSDVLKDMGKVRLKKVERSPGGTPSRSKPDSEDPASLIALALRKRFAQMHQIHESPEKDYDERDSFSESVDVFEDVENVTLKIPNRLRSRSPSPIHNKPLKPLLNRRVNRENHIRMKLDMDTSSDGDLPFGQHLLRKTGNRLHNASDATQEGR